MNNASIVLQLIKLSEQEIIEKIDESVDEILKNNFTKETALDLFFLDAIKLKLLNKNSNSIHIYLNKNEIPQIELFDILVNKMPFVFFSHLLCNKAILKLIENKKEVVIVDAGIGRGVQMVGLLKMINNIKSIKKVTLIGIDGFTDSIIYCTNLFNNVKKELNYTFNFEPIVSMLEDIQITDINNKIPLNAEIVIVNNSFSIHHFKQKEQRKHYFKILYEIPNVHIFLTEPSSNHFTSNWQERTKNAFEHYSYVFNTIEQLDITENEKMGLKKFFKREIDDIVGNEENERVEKIELADNWIAYIEDARFTLQPIFDENIDCTLNEILYTKRENNKYVSLDYQTYPVINLFYGTKK